MVQGAKGPWCVRSRGEWAYTQQVRMAGTFWVCDTGKVSRRCESVKVSPKSCGEYCVPC
jgi:hypothetical protein